MMSVVVRATTRLLFPMLLVYSAYVIMNGHLTPGGGFQGGVVAGAAFILLSLAMGYGKMSSAYNEMKLSVVENLAAISYVAIGLTGLVGGAFLFNWVPHGTLGSLFSAGFLLPLNIAIGVKVGAGLFVVSLMMLALGWEEDSID